MDRVREWEPSQPVPKRDGGYSVVLEWNEMALTRLLAATKDGYRAGGYPALVGAIRRAIASPLVVIDPEDRKQVERLAKDFQESDHIAPWHDLHSETRSQIAAALQAALREFANPTPPIEEPTGLGAVVEAINDNHYLLAYPGEEYPWMHVGIGSRCNFRDINVTRVLSEGVPAEVTQ